VELCKLSRISVTAHWEQLWWAVCCATGPDRSVAFMHWHIRYRYRYSCHCSEQLRSG